MKKYVITNIVENYGEEIEVYFTRNGRKYLLVTDALWDPLYREDILPDGYDLFIEGDEEDEWLLLDEKAAQIDYYFFNEAVKTYQKQEAINNRERGY